MKKNVFSIGDNNTPRSKNCDVLTIYDIVTAPETIDGYDADQLNELPKLSDFTQDEQEKLKNFVVKRSDTEKYKNCTSFKTFTLLTDKAEIAIDFGNAMYRFFRKFEIDRILKSPILSLQEFVDYTKREDVFVRADYILAFQYCGIDADTIEFLKKKRQDWVDNMAKLSRERQVKYLEGRRKKQLEIEEEENKIIADAIVAIKNNEHVDNEPIRDTKLFNHLLAAYGFDLPFNIRGYINKVTSIDSDFTITFTSKAKRATFNAKAHNYLRLLYQKIREQ